MHVIARKPLLEFTQRYPDAKGSLDAWWTEAQKARWLSPADIRSRYGTASFLGDNRVVFNIRGNHYRLVVRINYGSATVFVCFVGTHAEYDQIDGETV